ncbi:XRE family transcriptional regulator [Mesobaculum littorinae]|uniref:XRE family transcriptional regulator n=1 Tax=Mesobaculum littorinae TaxID=2486419 RepID=A0A438AKW4_9RHOB|nr:XRE family transcriptional regulator [Mesobaculum littorinae]RVV99310.1 XRE family transcriptional regulator [Mesobaculum littorinae]
MSAGERDNRGTGGRIRARRLDLGIRQAGLAARLGISASYLNLIEHDRRRIGGRLLNAIARELDTEPGVLAEGAEVGLLDALRTAAAMVRHDAAPHGGAAAGGEAAVAATAAVTDAAGRAGAAGPGPAARPASLAEPGSPPELDRLEAFAAAYPGWAGLLAAQARHIAQRDQALATLSDRLTHDPFLSESMHALLSAATSIRATATILRDEPELEPDWRARFHRNLDSDGQRLADTARALAAYLDGAADPAQAAAASPQEEVEAWLAARNYRLPELETELEPGLNPDADPHDVFDPSGPGRAHVRDTGADSPAAASGDAGAQPQQRSPGAVPTSPPGFAALLSAPDAPQSAAGRALARAHLSRARDEARAMPRAALLAELAHGIDPARIAARFGVGPGAALRRLGGLEAAAAGRPFGLILCDGTGTTTFRRPLDGFALPRFGAGCPLWPLYQTLGRPGWPLRAVLELPGQPARRFTAWAVAETRRAGGFDGPEIVEAAMLLTPGADALRTLGGADSGPPPPDPVGTSCRICPRGGCLARREPSVLAASEEGGGLS